jgi:hypothetical protein
VLEFVFQAVSQQLVEVLPPSEDQYDVPIPGFSAASWRFLISSAEKALQSGDLAEAYRLLSDVRQKHSERREVQELAGSLEQKINTEVDALGLDDAVVPELAIPPSQLTTLSCRPDEGFLLSRINGTYTLGEIASMVPGSPFEVRLTLLSMMAREVVRLKGDAEGGSE